MSAVTAIHLGPGQGEIRILALDRRESGKLNPCPEPSPFDVSDAMTATASVTIDRLSEFHLPGPPDVRNAPLALTYCCSLVHIFNDCLPDVVSSVLDSHREALGIPTDVDSAHRLHDGSSRETASR